MTVICLDSGGASEAVSVLTIRAHKRFAVCSKVRLRKERRRGIDGLLIELSLDGCRISYVGTSASFALGDPLTLRLDGTEPIAARIRWLREGVIGLRFERPLHIAGLEQLILLCLGGAEGQARSAHGGAGAATTAEQRLPGPWDTLGAWRLGERGV